MNKEEPEGAKGSYRHNIDGLRGIAVIGVVLFHLSSNLVPGGFVGVDIFFVISGYLVGKQILSENKAEQFSYVSFFARRVKRLAPAVNCFLLCNLVASLYVFEGVTSQVHVSVSSIWALFSGVNFHECFFVKRGYFELESSMSPLLHLWSLGVEEQFYFVWPFLLSFRRRTWIIVSTVIALSFTLSQGLLAVSLEKQAYYLLPSRMGQLGIGTLVALNESSWCSHSHHSLANLLAVIGGCLIGGSLAFMDQSIPYPGFASMFPSVGASILIATPGTWISQLLASQLLGLIGIMSFSLYLYHWPIMAYFRILQIEMNGLHGVAVLGCCAVCTMLSYIYVEEKCRYVTWRPRYIFLVYLVIPALMVGSFSVALINFPVSESVKMKLKKPAYFRHIGTLPEQFSIAEQNDPKVYWRQNLLDSSVKALQDWSLPGSMLLIGDSHALQVSSLIVEFCRGGRCNPVLHHSGNCPPLIFSIKFLKDNFSKECAQAMSDAPRVIREHNVTHVVLASLWGTNDPEPWTKFHVAVEETLSKLKELGVKVMVIGSGPIFPSLRRECPMIKPTKSSLSTVGCLKTELLSTHRASPVNPILAKNAAKYSAWYWSIGPYLCPAGVCSPYYKGRLMFWERTHHNEIMAITFARDLVQTSGIPAVWDSFLLGTKSATQQ